MKALLTGATGQDASWLAELLLKKGYEIHAFIEMFETKQNIEHLLGQINVHQANLLDQGRMLDVIGRVRPDEIYHFASQSDVGYSFEAPALTGEVTAMGTLRVLEAIRQSGISPKVYNAASSEMYGGGLNRTEASPMIPRSPYAVAKLFSYHLCRVYRLSYGMHVSNGILFNHESERRGLNFVTRKIAHAVARGQAPVLGNIKARRDWGYAPEYVEGIWRMMQLEQPVDLVLATGEDHSVEEFLNACWEFVGKPTRWKYAHTLERPWDVHQLSGKPSKAKKLIGWDPKVKFKELVWIMMGHETK